MQLPEGQANLQCSKYMSCEGAESVYIEAVCSPNPVSNMDPSKELTMLYIPMSISFNRYKNIRSNTLAGNDVKME